MHVGVSPFITGPCLNLTPIYVTEKSILVLPSVSETAAADRIASRINDLPYVSFIQVTKKNCKEIKTEGLTF
jgi:hypothetical protein